MRFVLRCLATRSPDSTTPMMSGQMEHHLLQQIGTGSSDADRVVINGDGGGPHGVA